MEETFDPPPRLAVALNHPGLLCSFCDKHEDDVAVMIVNGDIIICDECVSGCAEIVRKSKQHKRE